VICAVRKCHQPSQCLKFQGPTHKTTGPTIGAHLTDPYARLHNCSVATTVPTAKGGRRGQPAAQEPNFITVRIAPYFIPQLSGLRTQRALEGCGGNSQYESTIPLLDA